MSERRPFDFVIALVATLMILGLLFCIFLVWVEIMSRRMG